MKMTIGFSPMNQKIAMNPPVRKLGIAQKTAPTQPLRLRWIAKIGEPDRPFMVYGGPAGTVMPRRRDIIRDRVAIIVNRPESLEYDYTSRLPPDASLSSHVAEKRRQAEDRRRREERGDYYFPHEVSWEYKSSGEYPVALASHFRVELYRRCNPYCFHLFTNTIFFRGLLWRLWWDLDETYIPNNDDYYIKVIHNPTGFFGYSPIFTMGIETEFNAPGR